MFLVYENGRAIAAKDLESVRVFRVRGNNITDYDQGITFASYETDEEALARFDDVINAASSDQKVYDFRKDVGYWKEKEEKPKATRGRKPKAEESAPAEHTPAPKK